MLNGNKYEEEAVIPAGLKHLVEGYTEYAKEVVLDRAIPGIDGFKPSQRRILYTMKYIEKVKDLTKCADTAGSVLKLHPHGQASVYSTMVRMVDRSEVMNIPLLKGQGNFGKVYRTTAPAADRYTECELAEISEEVFRGIEGVEMIPSYNNKLKEPTNLPVSFMNVLCNPSQGIAVGLASDIPGFNFNELTRMLINYLETDEVKGYLEPDFSTRGYYVKNETELKKIMETGKGKIKLRGKWHIEGKTIVIDDIPYYTTVDEIKKSLENEHGAGYQVEGISDVRNETDRVYGLRLAIDCRTKKVVDQVLTEVIRVTNLQMTKTTNIVVIVDNKPCEIGVKDLIIEWVKFREDVLRKKLKLDLAKVEAAIPQYEILVELLSDEMKRQPFVKTLAEQGSNEAKKLLRGWFEGASESIFDWILGLSLRSLSGVASRLKKLESLKVTKKQLEEDLADIRKVILREQKELDAKYKFPRQTEVTDVDYVFEKKDVKVKAEPVPVVVTFKDKFIKKHQLDRLSEDLDGIRCMSDDIISFIDTKGRLLRVDLDQLLFSTKQDRGTYLPVYLDVEDDFDVVCYELIADKKIGYVFDDGFASVVDYNEWVGMQRCTRMTANGVSPLASSIVGEFDFSKSHLLLLTNTGKFGFVTTDFKQKHRTARTKLVKLKEEDRITTVIPITYTEILKLVSAPEKYTDKLSLLDQGDTFNIDVYNELINE